MHFDSEGFRTFLIYVLDGYIWGPLKTIWKELFSTPKSLLDIARIILLPLLVLIALALCIVAAVISFILIVLVFLASWRIK